MIMVCSDERKEGRYPFDIQHRTVVGYKSESSSDFEQLKEQIKERIQTLMTKGDRLRELAESDHVALREGLSQAELAVLAAVARDAVFPNSSTSVYWSLCFYRPVTLAVRPIINGEVSGAA